MANASNDRTGESFFGNVISTYARAQAIKDGVLINAGTMSQEVGFKWTVALTSAAWADCVAWSEDDNRKQAYQDESGRSWDVLLMASHAILTATGSGDRLLFQLYRVHRDGQSMEVELTMLKLIVGSCGQGEPVITILLPDED